MKDGQLGDLGKDASGHLKAGDIGDFLKNKINEFAKGKNIDLTLKYIDPTYMIRTVAANSYDKKLCRSLYFFKFFAWPTPKNYVYKYMQPYY